MPAKAQQIATLAGPTEEKRAMGACGGVCALVGGQSGWDSRGSGTTRMDRGWVCRT